MPAKRDDSWEKILKRQVGRKGEAPGAKPVRLSDLKPPGGAAPPDGGPAGIGRRASPAAPRVPSRPPGPPRQTPAPLGTSSGRSSGALSGASSGMSSGASSGVSSDARGTVEELRTRLEESEAARRKAEARVAELERELAARPSGGDAGTDVARLRRELEEAHTIIRAIEEAYLAGGGEPAP